MALTKNEKYLIVGTNDGILYSWDLDKDDSFVTLEIHKDKGAISNIVPIQKPLCMFGLN
jgi:WD40 repeat protein